MSSVTVEEILAHSDWLQRLARKLVRDSGEAEDLVQDTYLVALRRSPGGGALRPWLATVLRNLAFNRNRASLRRAARERATSPADGPSSPEDLLLATEAQEVLARAVARLDEPYRSVIVQRYFRGLSSKKIAQLQGTEASTVRSQLARGIEKLRSSLDGEFGDRRTWAGLVGALLPESSPTTGLVGAGLVLLALVGSVIGGWVFLGDAPTASPEERVRAASLEPLSSAPEEGTAPNSERLGMLAPADPGGTAGSIQRGSTASTEIRGRFLYPSGEPVVGMEVHLTDRARTIQRRSLVSPSIPWDDQVATTDEEGNFSIQCTLPYRRDLVLSVHRTGHVPERWLWRTYEVGSLKDLGEVTLRLGGTITGRLLRSDGSPLLDESWEVKATEVRPDTFNGHLATRVEANVNRATGAFLLEDVPPGQVDLKPFSWLEYHREGPRVEVLAGENVHSEFACVGRDFSREVHVVLFDPLGNPRTYPDPEFVRILTPTGPRTAPPDSRPGGYVFSDLEPGVYGVEITDPRFQPWCKEDVLTGSRVDVRLKGSGGLRLDVRDSLGQPVENYSVSALALSPPSSDPNQLTAYHVDPVELHDGEGSLPGGIALGLVPGSYEVRLRAPELGTHRFIVEDLGVAEVRLVERTFGAQEVGFLTGTAVYEDGSPAVGVPVYLVRAAPLNDSPESPVLTGDFFTSSIATHRIPIDLCFSGPEGEFRFDRPEEGTYAFHTTRETVRTGLPAFVVEGDEPPPPGRLTLNLFTWVEGRFETTPGRSFEGLQVAVLPVSDTLSAVDRTLYLYRESREVTSAGAFRTTHVPPGPVELYLQLARNTPQLPGASRLDEGLLLGRFDLVPGRNELALELPEEYPGHVRLRVLVDGAPMTGLYVQLHGHRVEEPFGFFGRPSRAFAGARTEQDGWTLPFPAFPETYAVEIAPRDDSWRYRSDLPLEVASGQAIEGALQFELHSGELHVVDAQGLPLVGATVQISPPLESPSEWSGPRMTTSAEGKVELTLVPGSYRLELVAGSGESEEALSEALLQGQGRPSVPFTWPHEGPGLHF